MTYIRINNKSQLITCAQAAQQKWVQRENHQTISLQGEKGAEMENGKGKATKN